MKISPEHPLLLCTPTRLVVQAGGIGRVAPFCKSRQWKHVLIVTDRFFTTSTPLVKDLVSALNAHGVEALICDNGEPNPTTALCDRSCAEVLAMAGDTVIDAVVALGGGSNIDLAKSLTLTLPFRRPVAEFVGQSNWPGRPLPLIALPTTSGTGSEITAGAILIQPGSATKVALMGNDLRPLLAIVDPELTMTCPARVTADAGIDALTHAIESWITMDASDLGALQDPDPAYSGRNPLTMLFARESVKLCFEHLPTAFREPSNLHARTGMSCCSLYAALSYATAGVHAVHGLAYALAGLTHETHGRTNAVLLPYVMDSLISVRTAELAEIGRIAGSQKTDLLGQARDAAVLTRALIQSLDIPVSLKDFGVKAQELDTLIQDGLAVVRLAKAYPIQPPAPAYSQIVRHAYEGRLSADPT